MAKVHFRDYNPKQIILFPQRLDKDIAENDPVRIVDTIVDQLKLGNFRKQAIPRARAQSLPPQDDAQGNSLRLHEQYLFMPQDRESPEA